MTKRTWRFNASLPTWLLLSWLFLFPLRTTLGQPLKTVVQRASWDTMPTPPVLFRWIASTALITSGLVLSPDYPNSHFDRFYILSAIQDKIHFHTHADNFLQCEPALAWAGLNLAGVKGRSQPLDRALIGVLAYGISTGITLGLKQTTHELRPDGYNYLSFPSGHTVNTFTRASLLDREFSGVSPWIPVGGYAMATSTGIFRMTNNKHWLSDVLVGPGLAYSRLKSRIESIRC